jgi:phospholipid-binding lipoprotein MlaA
MFKHYAPASALICALFLGGCASNGDPRDPLESMNRAVYSFNEGVDVAAIKPLATGYRTVMPQPVQNSVRNFFSNLDDFAVFVNDLLQFKVQQGVSDFMRMAFNTTFGLFGLVDMATEMGLKKHNEDFGQTLGKWGVGSGAYLVLPFFGSSSLRDGLGLVVDGESTDLVYDIAQVPVRN